MSSSETVSEALAERVVEINESTLADPVLHAAKRCLIDWVGVTVAGGARAPATLLRKSLAGAMGRSRLVPSGERVDARTAALINGTAAHTIELDDIFAGGLFHPGAPTIASALAIAQQERVSGEALLRAIVAGYELSTRIGVAVSPAHYDFWHSTGTVGTFGATAAAAAISRLEQGRTAHALATAATLASGLQQAFRSEAMSKPLHAGRAAETGVLAALAASSGLTGALDVLEGPRGFGYATCASGADWDGALANLRSEFHILRTTVKNHAACGHGHAAIDAVLALKDEHHFREDDVRRLRVATYKKSLEIMGGFDPTTEFRAKFSLPYCVSVALVTGRVRLEAFSPETLSHPAVRRVMGLVELGVDEEAERAYPERRSALVEIETADGRTLRRRAPTRKGDPDNPLTDAELEEKFKELTRDERVLSRLWRVEELADVGELEIGRPP